MKVRVRVRVRVRVTAAQIVGPTNSIAIKVRVRVRVRVRVTAAQIVGPTNSIAIKVYYLFNLFRSFDLSSTSVQNDVTLASESAVPAGTSSCAYALEAHH
jgi:hypothetical protein